MAGRMTYEVKVGGNVASLKKAPRYEPQDPPLYRVTESRNGCVEGWTDRKPFEVSFIIAFAGAVLAVAGYLLYRSEAMTETPRYLIAGVLGLAGAVVILKGIGTISDRRRMRIESERIVTGRTFLWIPFKREVHCKAEHVLCASWKDKRDPRLWHLDACVVLPRPYGGVTFARREGYAQIPTEEAARLKPYETALLEIHEEAKELAAALEVEFKPNFGPGPVPDDLLAFFSAEDLQAARDAHAAEEAAAEAAKEETENESKPVKKPRAPTKTRLPRTKRKGE
ncbi:MAG: hypothetical protein AMXMBFR7_07260 [Planctomycetota bacterium]